MKEEDRKGGREAAFLVLDEAIFKRRLVGVGRGDEDFQAAAKAASTIFMVIPLRDRGREVRAMNEHDDDVEAEVEEDAEFEKAEFPIPTEDEETEESGEEETTQMEDDSDPGKSEI